MGGPQPAATSADTAAAAGPAVPVWHESQVRAAIGSAVGKAAGKQLLKNIPLSRIVKEKRKRKNAKNNQKKFSLKVALIILVHLNGQYLFRIQQQQHVHDQHAISALQRRRIQVRSENMLTNYEVIQSLHC